MTNPPLFDNQDAFGCWWVVMNYLLGACYGGLSRALILNVTNPTHPCILNIVCFRGERHQSGGGEGESEPTL